MPRKFKPEHDILAEKVRKAIAGKTYAQALRERTLTIVQHVFERWPFPPKLKPEHAANYRVLLLKYANALVDLQEVNEPLLDRQVAGEISKAEYIQRIASQKRAQPVHQTSDEIISFLKRHELSPDKHFLGLWTAVLKAARASPTLPKDEN